MAELPFLLYFSRFLPATTAVRPIAPLLLIRYVRDSNVAPLSIVDFVVVFVSPFQTYTTTVSQAESSLLPAVSFTTRSLTLHYSLPLSALSLTVLFLYFC